MHINFKIDKNMKTDCYIYTLITGDFLFQVMETSDEQAEKRLIDLYQEGEDDLYSRHL